MLGFLLFAMDMANCAYSATNLAPSVYPIS